MTWVVHDNVTQTQAGSIGGRSEAEVVVIGAGIAGLTAAALLAHDGARVHVLERHNVPGGCASFYQRNGYRFDVGATLVSGFGIRGAHRMIFERLGVDVRAQPVEPAMIVHLPDGDVVRYGDARWNAERLRAFGPAAEPFWEEQERLADLAWDFSSRFPSLPADARGLEALARAFRPRQALVLPAIGRTVASIMPRDASPRLRSFVDAQLLITAQASAAEADLAYGATALDIAREGTVHLEGGIAAIAIALARAVRRSGGAITYGAQAEAIVRERGRISGVRLNDGRTIATRRVVAAIPAQNVTQLLGGDASLAARAASLPQRWGAFMAYVGLPPGIVPGDCALHHQSVADATSPLGEGNTTFFSFSAPGEHGRARNGGRALTISTHTDVARWERAYTAGTYDTLRATYAARLRDALERTIPGAWDAAEIVELATPHTFARYTGRARGLVGGVPQTPRTAGLAALSHAGGITGLYLAGDTIFPGQSTVGASLSGIAAARAAGAAF